MRDGEGITDQPFMNERRRPYIPGFLTRAGGVARGRGLENTFPMTVIGALVGIESWGHCYGSNISLEWT